MAFLRKLSIRSQLVILAITTIIVILSIIFHTYSMMSGMVTRSHEDYVKQTVSEIKKNVTSNKDVINRLMQNISYSEDVQSFLVENNNLAKYELFKKLNSLLSNQKELKEGIMDIVISGDDGAWVDLNGGHSYVSQMRQFIPPKVNAYYAGIQQFGSLYGTAEGIIFATTIYYLKQGDLFNTHVGTLYFIVNPKALVGEQEYATKQTNTQIYLLDRDQKVITSNTNEQVGSPLSGISLEDHVEEGKVIRWKGEPYVMQEEKLPDIRGSILSMVPKNELLRDLLDIRKQELIILSICLFILSIPFMFIINNILRPIKRLIFFMTLLKRGDSLHFKRRISLQGYMEISIMASEFNSMLDEIDHLTETLLETNTRLYNIELEKKKSELAFLRSQINPHFLYNTLEAITGLAVVEGQSKIKTMTRALSSIFRYSIKGADIVPLIQETKIIDAYLQIQQIRFADRFSVHHEFTEEALAYRVPRMILQPIIENAIYHGFEPSLRKGELWIKASIDDQGRLVVAVLDNGTGIAPGRLEELRSRLAAPASDLADFEEQKSIGLVNVNNRIKLMFGDDCGIQIESSFGNGTHIQLIIGEKRDQDA
ncbi:hypothetical protein BC351_14260 [Paenibacillus ferrarius]|uniref:Histidine kinase/HSP90-like ATPase domain-containing protein n=1 Tax=Paenibacillus ferrarius TaxID=1469647 RepID=A0A1V4H616_9BACL|nr:sensor histidine kinase [Paenibacillus ferrarius]OPH46646.1 hypothetical protein BC351_14260 [Paenibacillus ferrarius]